MNKKIYKVKNYCRLCKSKELKLSFDLGLSPIGDEYTLKKNKSPLMPLKILSCMSCGFKQLSIVVNEDRVYGEYLYTTSTSTGLKEHFVKSYKFIEKKISLKKKDLIIDIGSNDGSNLEIFKRAGYHTLGIEPSKNLCLISKSKNINTLNAKFTGNIVKKIIENKGYPRLICIYNLMANIDDLDDFTVNLTKLMKKDTIVAVESFSLAGIVKKNLFDNIYHEHLSYFHIRPLIKYFEKFNLEIFHAENNNIKGGSIKFFLRTKQNLKINLKKSLDYEKKLKLNSINTFKQIIRINKKNIFKIKKFMNSINGQIIAGYGASCGSTALIHYYNINKEIDIFLDDEKRRNNLYAPSTNIKVHKPNTTILKKINVVLIISWRYESIILKNFKKKYPKIFKNQEWFALLPKIKKIN